MGTVYWIPYLISSNFHF